MENNEITMAVPKVGKSMVLVNACIENKQKALKEGKRVVFDMTFEGIVEAWRNRDTSNNGIVIIDHTSIIK